MIEIGNYNVLKIKRKSSFGLYLSDGEGHEVLLPNKYIPENAEIGQTLEIFCYLDNEERPVATTLKPLIKRNEFGFLNVAEVNQYGAFLNWGLEKHLLVPFREQVRPMQEGKHYVVYCYLDPKSFRLVASARLERFLDNQDVNYQRGQEVDVLVSRPTDLGWEVIIDQKHKGLVYSDEIFQPLKTGDRTKGYIKKVRDDKKIDLSLQPLGFVKMEASARAVLEAVKANGGSLELHDRSDPQMIKDQLHMSKKTFKKAIGILYKAGKITISNEGISER